MSDPISLVRALAGYWPEHSDYSGYYYCQFCNEERREHIPYDLDSQGWVGWITHKEDCPVLLARQYVEEYDHD